jgi:hypothetical protein
MAQTRAGAPERNFLRKNVYFDAFLCVFAKNDLFYLYFPSFWRIEGAIIPHIAPISSFWLQYKFESPNKIWS